jgi:hypothetical protein
MILYFIMKKMYSKYVLYGNIYNKYFIRNIKQEIKRPFIRTIDSNNTIASILSMLPFLFRKVDASKDSLGVFGPKISFLKEETNEL